MPITLADLTWTSGSNNTPGLAKIGFVPVEDIDVEASVIQSDPTSTGSFADLVTATGNLILKNGKRLIEIYVTMGKNALTDNVEGPIDSGYNANELTFFHPGDSDTVRGFATWVKNNKLVFVVQDKEGNKYIFGSKLFPAVRKEIKGTTGAKGGDEKGRNFTFMTEGPRPYLKFTGSVVDGKGTSASADDVAQVIFNA